MGNHHACAQCGRKASVLDMACPELPDGTWDPNSRVCRNRAQCRDRWWARFAYEMELSQA